MEDVTTKPAYPSRIWRSALALTLTGASLWYGVHRWNRQAPLLQREYLAAYAWSGLGWDIGKHPKYTVLHTYKQLLALPADTGTFHKDKIEVDPPQFHLWLRIHIYEGNPLWLVLLWPLIFSGVIGVLSLGCATYYDGKANQATRSGRLVRGPRIIPRWRFNLRSWNNRGFYIETK